jgi:hypothetical protein
MTDHTPTLTPLPDMKEARIMVRMKDLIPTALIEGELVGKYLWPVFVAYAEGRLNEIEHNDQGGHNT